VQFDLLERRFKQVAFHVTLRLTVQVLYDPLERRFLSEILETPLRMTV
jgi:hypothetical protein